MSGWGAQLERELSGRPVYTMGSPGSSLLDYAERMRFAHDRFGIVDFVLLVERGDVRQALCGSNKHPRAMSRSPDPRTADRNHRLPLGAFAGGRPSIRLGAVTFFFPVAAQTGTVSERGSLCAGTQRRAWRGGVSRTGRRLGTGDRRSRARILSAGASLSRRAPGSRFRRRPRLAITEVNPRSTRSETGSRLQRSPSVQSSSIRSRFSVITWPRPVFAWRSRLRTVTGTTRRIELAAEAIARAFERF